MPLPDANNYSMRIYELLKETDLENLSYAQFQGVAEKLFIEPENEDEMRRLVLVQLARMAVRGDWDGFLTGGGGGGGAPTNAEYVVMALNGTLTNERKLTAGSRITITDGGAGGDVTIAADASPVTSLVAGTNITLSPATGLGDVTITASGGGSGGFTGLPGVGPEGMPSGYDKVLAGSGYFGGNGMSSSTFSWNNRFVHFVPIIPASDTDVTDLGYHVVSGSFTGKLGIYSSDTSTGAPNAILKETPLQSATTGYVTAAVSAGLTLTAGTLYYAAIAQGTTAASTGVRSYGSGGYGATYSPTTGIADFNVMQLRSSLEGLDTGLPTPITTASLTTVYGQLPMIFVGA